MIYILTTCCIVLGICYHVMQKIRSLRIKFPLFQASKIWTTFFGEEWDTLIVSFLSWVVFELATYITIYNNVKLPMWFTNWAVFILAAVWGYAGQRLAYKYLGTAENVLNKNVDDLKRKYGADAVDQATEEEAKKNQAG